MALHFLLLRGMFSIGNQPLSQQFLGLLAGLDVNQSIVSISDHAMTECTHVLLYSNYGNNNNWLLLAQV